MKIIYAYIILTLFIFSSSLFANNKQNILVLHSYHQSYKWTDDINKGIKSVLDDKFTQMELFVEYMDTKRYVDKNHYNNLFQTYKNKYKNITFDLIISSDNNAFNFLKQHNKSLFKNAPIVFNGVNYIKKEDMVGLDRFTGINEKADLKQNYELIKQLHPNIENIYTIIDATTTGKIVKQEARKVESELSGDGVNYEIIDNVTLSELKDRVKNLPQNSALLLSVFFRSKDNQFFEYYEISHMISQNSTTPLYGLWDFNLEHGIIGGYLTSGFFHGKEAALMGLKILEGEQVKDVPVKYKSPNNYMFDFTELNRHKIDTDLLPKDHFMFNKPISFFELYKKEIFTLLAVFILMIVFIILLSINIQKRKIAEKKIIKQLAFEQTLMDTVDAPIYYKDKNGLYIGCNKAFEAHVEKSKENIIGKDIFDILPIDIAKIYNEKDKELLINGKSQEYEGQQKSKDGLIKNLIFYKSALYDEYKKIDGFVGAIFDITQLKQTTEKLNDLNKTLELKVRKRTLELEDSNDELEQTIHNLETTQDKLVESEKMASLGGLVAGVAHEINTPMGVGLTAVTHFVDITQDINHKYEKDLMSQEEFETYLKDSRNLANSLYKNIKRTAELVTSFKRIATDQTTEEKREFNLKQYIDKILLSINNITKKTNLQLSVNCAEDINLNSYPGLFSQIISNLVINSIKHGYDEKEKGNISIEAIQAGNKLTILYKDDGKGISAENITRIFDPFFTTNREFGGTGLGLNVIYNLVTNNLKGSITCNSEEKHGVEFIVEIPT